jgi:hypothetical protein
MLACLLALMLLGGSAVLFSAFIAWVLREYSAATKYRNLTRLHEATKSEAASAPKTVR